MGHGRRMAAVFFWPWREQRGQRTLDAWESTAASSLELWRGALRSWVNTPARPKLRRGGGNWKHICSAFDPSVCGPARRSPRLPTLRLTRKQSHKHELVLPHAALLLAPAAEAHKALDFLKMCKWKTSEVCAKCELGYLIIFPMQLLLSNATVNETKVPFPLMKNTHLNL